MLAWQSAGGDIASRRRALVARRGYTLVETLIAVLLISIVVTSVFSLVLTARVASKKTERRGQAVYYERRVMEALKGFVTADTTGPPGPGNAPNGWGLPGALPVGVYALSVGVHDVSSWLSPSFCAADPSPSKCALTYTVTPACGGPTCPTSVKVDVKWEEFPAP